MCVSKSNFQYGTGNSPHRTSIAAAAATATKKKTLKKRSQILKFVKLRFIFSLKHVT